MSTMYSVGAMNQLGDALEKAGFSAEDVTKLKQYTELGRVLDVLCGRAEIISVAQVAKNILEFVTSTTVSVPVGPFVARDHFKVDTSQKAKAKISWLSDNFKSWFLDKVEEQAGGDSILRTHKLTTASVDAPIIAELGGEVKAETTLVEAFALMEKQGKGEAGVLLTNGYANIFYVRDDAGILRAVYVYWVDGGWGVHANSVTDSCEWYAGYRVFSRNS